MEDRHARHRRADADRRRRPVDGFRTSGTERFRRIVDDAVASLPPELLAYLDGVEITVEAVPPADPLGAGDELLLGLYRTDPDPERLTLFRRPLEARARDKDELVALIGDTVVQEIADHFGIDDDRLDELGWG